MPPKGLVTALNKMREMSVQNQGIYHQYVPVITQSTDISVLGQPILTQPAVQNEFMSQLINQIVFTQFETKYFNNPLQVLEGDRIPLGYAGRSIYVNPAKGRQFNVEDFAGLLQKYEAKIAVQYHAVNMDLQYPVTVSRHILKRAFTAWNELDSFIDQLTQSLYNGAFIDEFRYTKNMVTAAYQNNRTPIRVVNPVSSEAAAKEFLTIARGMFFNFRAPSTAYNGWGLVGDPTVGPITTWTDPEDIIFILRNDIAAYLDVNVLASAFNIDSAKLIGNIIYVDNFDVYDDNGVKIYDGSSIVGMMADKAWFKIKRQDMFLDEFYNANNRTWQYYLNLTKMYSQSFFANGVIFATELPNVPVTALDYNNTPTLAITTGESEGLDINVTPLNATTPIEYTSSDDEVLSITVDANNDRHITVTGLKAGTSTLTATAGSASVEMEVTVTDPAAVASLKTAKKVAAATNTTTVNTKTDDTKTNS